MTQQEIERLVKAAESAAIEKIATEHAAFANWSGEYEADSIWTECSCGWTSKNGADHNSWREHIRSILPNAGTILADYVAKVRTDALKPDPLALIALRCPKCTGINLTSDNKRNHKCLDCGKTCTDETVIPSIASLKSALSEAHKGDEQRARDISARDMQIGDLERRLILAESALAEARGDVTEIQERWAIDNRKNEQRLALAESALKEAGIIAASCTTGVEARNQIHRFLIKPQEHRDTTKGGDAK
jgi:hypothetical protein